MENKQLLIFRSIDKILWNDWDPIGVNQISEVRDEYQTYVPGIYELKRKNASIEVLAERLIEIETYRMGLDGDIDKCSVVARKIIEL